MSADFMSSLADYFLGYMSCLITVMFCFLVAYVMSKVLRGDGGGGSAA